MSTNVLSSLSYRHFISCASMTKQWLNVSEMACVGITQRDRLHRADIKKQLHLQKKVNYRIQ